MGANAGLMLKIRFMSSLVRARRWLRERHRRVVLPLIVWRPDILGVKTVVAWRGNVHLTNVIVVAWAHYLQLDRVVRHARLDPRQRLVEGSSGYDFGVRARVLRSAAVRGFEDRLAICLLVIQVDIVVACALGVSSEIAKVHAPFFTLAVDTNIHTGRLIELLSDPQVPQG